MDDHTSIQLLTAATLLDAQSMKPHWTWNKFRLADRGEAARRAIKAMNILQVRLCPVVSRTNVSC